MLTVRALRAGYHGKLRAPGETFRIAGRRELGSWMELVTERGRLVLSAEPEAPAAAAGAEPSPTARLQRTGATP